MKRCLATCAVALMAAPAASQAAGDPEACKTVRLEQVNWTGVTAKTETLAWMLEQLGYETENVTASVPIMFQSLANNDRDAFLGLWLPTQHSMVEAFMKKGQIDIVAKNLENAKYTLAVQDYVYEAGVRHFSDLDKYKEKFEGKIHGIEAGNDGNQLILDMIADDAYGLADWELVPSSEAGMLTHVRRSLPKKGWDVWLGWEPHPMNLNIDMKFLDGGEDYFGPNKGGATVYTLTRTGYAWECPNVGQLLENYQFTLDEQNMMGDFVINQDMTYLEAGQKLIREKPELLDRWFSRGGTYASTGVSTFDGGSKAKAVVAEALGIE
ncbi:glycine/betaine ABC transporter substrate-binding protein [Ferruginivarius sediminum]|uniref:Glycine/betaine ABC transporter substrate-binding protein n=1 Tax=Ferruginivarius sediminum TaxID=2661937 RepID=A0A369TC51_9PROT|nr:glycine/betaine ABC transporter substrate-binding protein [Ferruginivarius sediminum]